MWLFGRERADKEVVDLLRSYKDEMGENTAKRPLQHLGNQSFYLEFRAQKTANRQHIVSRT